MVFWQQSLQWFFPQSDPLTALMAAYAIFAISFILRPLGGIFGGHVGDKFGRKNALSWSIILMTLARYVLHYYQAIKVSVFLHRSCS
jgi:MFS family permease